MAVRMVYASSAPALQPPGGVRRADEAEGSKRTATVAELALRPNTPDADCSKSEWPHAGFLPLGSTTSREDGSKSVPLPERAADSALPSRVTRRWSHAGIVSHEMPARALKYGTAAPVAVSPDAASTRVGRIPPHLARVFDQTSHRSACFPRDLEVWRSVTRRAWIVKSRRSPLVLSAMERQLVVGAA
jgi:hypothetical protein